MRAQSKQTTQGSKNMKNSRKVLVTLLAGLGSVAMSNAHALVEFSSAVDGYARSGAITETFGVTTSTPSSATVDDSASSADASSASSASAWVNSYGAYRAEANGRGNDFEAMAHLVQSLTVTNDLGIDADYSLDFFIYYGSMAAYGTGTGYTSFDLKIVQDSSATLFTSAASISNTGSLTTSGTILNGAYHSGNTYDWGGTHVTVSLGTLAAGESTTIDYDLVSTAFGDYTDCGEGEFSAGDGIYGDMIYGVPGTGSCGAFTALGDPFLLNASFGTPPVVTATPAVTVPEPAGLSLIALGLGALARQRRKRKVA